MTPAKVEKLGVPRKLIDQLAKKKFIGTKLEKKDSSELRNKIFGNNISRDILHSSLNTVVSVISQKWCNSIQIKGTGSAGR